MDDVVTMIRGEFDDLRTRVQEVISTALNQATTIAHLDRGLKDLWTLTHSQAAVISDLDHRLKDAESLAHSHPKASTPTVLEALAAINSTLRRIEKRGLPKKLPK